MHRRTLLIYTQIYCQTLFPLKFVEITALLVLHIAMAFKIIVTCVFEEKMRHVVSHIVMMSWILVFDRRWKWVKNLALVYSLKPRHAINYYWPIAMEWGQLPLFYSYSDKNYEIAYLIWKEIFKINKEILFFLQNRLPLLYCPSVSVKLFQLHCCVYKVFTVPLMHLLFQQCFTCISVSAKLLHSTTLSVACDSDFQRQYLWQWYASGK